METIFIITLHVGLISCLMDRLAVFIEFVLLVLFTYLIYSLINFLLKTNRIKKFILHTNFPGHTDFNSYIKCNFIIHCPHCKETFLSNGDSFLSVFVINMVMWLLTTHIFTINILLYQLMMEKPRQILYCQKQSGIK